MCQQRVEAEGWVCLAQRRPEQQDDRGSAQPGPHQEETVPKAAAEEDDEAVVAEGAVQGAPLAEWPGPPQTEEESQPT